MPLLPSITRVAPVFFTRHFLVTEIVGFVLTAGINGMIDYFMQRYKGPWYLINSTTVTTVLVFCLIMSFLVFAGGGEVHKRLKAGKAEPVRCYAFKDTFVKRFFFFPLGEPNWKCRLPLFIWWCVMVPGVITIILLYFFCWASRGFAKMGSEACNCTLAEYIIWMELWKGSTVVFMTAVNYAAAHNDEQSELQETLLEEGGEAEQAEAASPQTREMLYDDEPSTTQA